MASEPATETPITNGNGITAAEVDTAEEAPVAATKPEASLTPEVIEKEIEEEATKEIEKPKDPSPTPAPVAAPPKVTPAAPTQPAAPPKPMTWASRAAAAAAASATPAKPTPVVPTKVGTPPVQPRAAPPTPAVPATQPSQSTPTTSEPAEKESPPQSQGWQTAGSDQKRQARPQAASSPTVKDDTLGYVRNVTEKVSVEELKATLAKYGELVYFDVNRSKVCFLGFFPHSIKLTAKYRTVHSSSLPTTPATTPQLQPTPISSAARILSWSLVDLKLLHTVELDTTIITAEP